MLKLKTLTSQIIAINVLIFIIVSLLISYNPSFIDYIALKPAFLLQGKYLWTILTSMFMHASFSHLFFNMFSLFFIGSFLERIIGKKRFLYFYIISGIFAGLFFSLLSFFLGYGFLEKIFASPETIAVGASGALFGLLGILAVIIPNKKVYLIAGPLVAIIIQAIVGNLTGNSFVLSTISFIATIYIFLCIALMFSPFAETRKIIFPLELPFYLLPVIAILPLIIVGLFIELPIGNMAHLGGLLAGLGYGYYLRNKYRKKVFMLNRMIR